MEIAPQARLITNAFCALRMATWWPLPMDRVYAINPGDTVDVGDRKLSALRPPLFDNLLTAALYDEKSGALFSADAFGALLREPAEDATEIPEAALAGGMLGWATSDSPWAP